MRTRAIVGFVLVLFACAPDENDVLFAIPAEYREAVRSVSIRAYEPPMAEPFDCEALAFGRVRAEVLRLSQVLDTDRSSDAERSLAGRVDRSGRKIFYAEGVGADGRAVIKGCTEVPELASDTEVVIQPEPVAVISANPSRLTATAGQPFDMDLAVVARNTRLDPLGQWPVQWNIVSAEGEGPIEITTTGPDGTAILSADAPSFPGPLVMDIRARWSEVEAFRIPGFVAPRAETVDLGAPLRSFRKGRIGPNGEPGFVGLVSGEPGRVAFIYTDQSNGQVISDIVDTNAAAEAIIGLIELESRSRDQVVLVSNLQWIEVDPDGSSRPRTYQRPNLGIVGVPRALWTFGPCDESSPYLMATFEQAIIPGPDVLALYDLTGNFLRKIPERLELLGTSCLSDTEGELHRAALFNLQGQAALELGVEQGLGSFEFTQYYSIGGPGVNRAIGGGPRYLLGTQLRANTLTVTRSLLDLSGDEVSLRVEGTDFPDGTPVFNDGGDIDGDSQLDVVSLLLPIPLELGRDLGEGQMRPPVRYSLMASLGREYLGERIVGSTTPMDVAEYPYPTVKATSFPILFVLDFNQDGFDDILVPQTAVVNDEGGMIGSSHLDVFYMGGS